FRSAGESEPGESQRDPEEDPAREEESGRGGEQDLRRGGCAEGSHPGWRRRARHCQGGSEAGRAGVSSKNYLARQKINVHYTTAFKMFQDFLNISQM
ncbi:hypothetical protein AVEN_57148-1, partial [Araneus ventricosus]